VVNRALLGHFLAVSSFCDLREGAEVVSLA
jgi:hypothetical protein